MFFFRSNLLSEQNLIKLLDSLDGEKEGDQRTNPLYVLERQRNVMRLAPTLQNVWNKLKAIENKSNYVLAEPLHSRIRDTASEIRQNDARYGDNEVSRDIERLFPDASQDFKNLALYLGKHLSFIRQISFIHAVVGVSVQSRVEETTENRCVIQ